MCIHRHWERVKPPVTPPRVVGAKQLDARQVRHVILHYLQLAGRGDDH
jgi:hypothetical protein